MYGWRVAQSLVLDYFLLHVPPSVSSFLRRTERLLSTSSNEAHESAGLSDFVAPILHQLRTISGVVEGY